MGLRAPVYPGPKCLSQERKLFKIESRKRRKYLQIKKRKFGDGLGAPFIHEQFNRKSQIESTACDFKNEDREIAILLSNQKTAADE